MGDDAASQISSDGADMYALSDEWSVSGTCEWKVGSDGTLVVRPIEGSEGTLGEWGSGGVPWKAKASEITSVRFEGTVHAVTCEWMFSNCSNLTSLDLTRLDTSKVKNMCWMFSRCTSLTSVDLSQLDTSEVTDMRSMFSNCSKLTSLDLSDLKVPKATDMSFMFEECSSLASLDLSGLNAPKLTNMRALLFNCSKLTSLDLSDVNTSAVKNMSALFYGCSSLASLDLSDLDTSAATDMSSMFYNCSSLAALDLSSWNVANVTAMASMFTNCSKLASIDFSGWKTSGLTDMGFMFYGCSSLTALDLSSWNTAKVTDTDRMFAKCLSLCKIKLGTGCTVLGGLPSQTYTVGSWCSDETGVWYTPREIAANRLGIADTYIRNPFVDVSQKTAHSGDILWLSDAGISTGWIADDGTRTFRPYEGVARADMAAFLFRLAERWGEVNESWQPTGSSPFADVSEDTPHYREIRWLAASGVSEGWTSSDGTRTFRPYATIARCDMAAFMRRLAVDVAGRSGKPAASYGFFSDVSTDSPHADDVMWLAANGVSTGWDEEDGTKTFRPYRTVARCDMAAFLHRLDGVK